MDMKKLALLICLFPLTAQAMPCQVTHIADGDTFTCSTGQRVRIAQIDSPEHDQPYGQEAKAELSGFIMGKTVDLKPVGKTFARSYDRIVAHVAINDTDVGAAMIEQGYAWSATKYSPPASYDQYQAKAQAEHIGLWQSAATPPWVWRHRR